MLARDRGRQGGIETDGNAQRAGELNLTPVRLSQWVSADLRMQTGV